MPTLQETRKFHLPVKGYDVITAVNRAAAATGSLRTAGAAAHARYNGHFLHMDWNSYNSYYICRYTWSGDHVICRTPCFSTSMEVAKAFYGNEGLGAGVLVTPRAEDVALAEADPMLLSGEEDVKKASWWTWKHDLVHSALRDNTTDLLIAASSENNYDDLRRMDARTARANLALIAQSGAGLIAP